MNKMKSKLATLITVLEKDSNEIKVEMTIPTDLEIFSGHFPDMPILPGICLIQVCGLVCELFQNKNCTLKTIKLSKFFAPAKPGSTLTVIQNSIELTDKTISTTTRFESQEGKIAQIKSNYTLA